MVSTAPFSSLDHAITVARDIWFNKLDLSCWIEALSSRDCLNQYLTDATESTLQNTGSTEDTINTVNTYTHDNSWENTYFGTNIARQFDRTHSRERRKTPMDRRQIQDSANVSHGNFDLNKEPRFEDDMSKRLNRDSEKFLALYFSTGKTDTTDDKW
ncbi:hypothetical protein PIB30_039796 [Stylosanthes scabra]|uniref:Uncharacterized protein n=1 Tax=Stylosanthes scabra TaxID=79078 RepID=A0ABU6YF44_9FABA|nr:hypothetical protein [Stylosanthes scabra]